MNASKLSASQKGNVLSEYNKSKGFAPILMILGVVLIIVIAGGAYYFGKSQPPKSQNAVISQTPQPVLSPSASPDETANWKTYKNDKYNISFQYPVTLNQDLSPGETDDSGAMLRTVFRSLDKKMSLTLVVALTTDDLRYGHGLEGMKEVLNSNIRVGSFIASIIGSETDISWPDYKTGDPIYVFYGVVGIKEKPLIVEYVGEKNKATLQDFTKILSTFKFTN